MNKKFQIIAVLLIFGLVLFTGLTSSSVNVSEGQYGILTILPPLVAILLAFVTRQVIISLFVGVFSGVLLLYNGNLFIAFLRTLDEYIIASLADSWYAAIIIFTLTIGGMIGVVSRMGGTQAIADELSKKARSPVSAQVVAAILGCLVFFDDYANLLIVGPTMRPLSDKHRVSREKLAYIVDSTAAPVAGLAFVSTWIGFEVGLINDVFAGMNMNVNAYEIFVRSIPYAFYNIFGLGLVFVIALSGRDFGPMYKAEIRARRYGKVLADDAKALSGTIDDIKEVKNKKVMNAVIPILTMIMVTLLGLWYNGYLNSEGIDPFTFEGLRVSFGNADSSQVLVWAAIVSSLVAGALAVGQKILTMEETISAWVEGMKGLLEVSTILVLSWSLGSVIGSVDTAGFLIQVVTDAIPFSLLPLLIFVLSCTVAFSTGSSWGTMAIMVPLAVPLAASYVATDVTSSPMVIASLSAILSGSIFGDHCSPISDTTILSSMSAGSDHLHHVLTQVPYALTGAVLSVIGYLLIGFAGLNPVIALVVGFALMIGFVRVKGRIVESDGFENLSELEMKI
ncbi:transporter, NhaC family (TC 2.A.35) [Dethiosulfatibacter aminovorans DSM 17477]|uniref:Transporter, NhaC family (TC 2.A.35) n=1 Tax=Dethiosulfatibacter aminovorans DSM 17477 TaxID=1121476 RepID=A0A1M6ACN3_9FIRM|nr:Na+/H+ antiporter NhaC family protein [Dethiosulfatibacter aminovorans]SHI34252.1 transporter, NhaC family (TC 2.A.35) [Dethiosulfatibacter aminovorans DSM 17477]